MCFQLDLDIYHMIQGMTQREVINRQTNIVRDVYDEHSCLSLPDPAL